MAEMNYQPDARCQSLYETTQQFLDRIPREPETLPRYLQMQGRFPQLSVNNAILMAVQYPTATRYHTLADWQTDGVTVQSGQQPISILIPDGTYQRANGSIGTKLAVQQVYDITQTDAVSKPEQADLRQTLHAMLMRPVCPVEVIQRSGGAVFVPDGPKVQIGRGMSMEAAIATLSLALAHGELSKFQRDYVPTEPLHALYARSVSYGFCAHYEIQPENYSFQDVGMILRGCNNRELKKHLETIRTGLGTLLDRTEKARIDLIARTSRQEQEER